MNSQSAEAYRYMYSRVFRFIREQLHIEVKWHHIHGEGIKGVTVDQDQGNIAGKALLMHS